jgi:hypothetical protein
LSLAAWREKVASVVARRDRAAEGRREGIAMFYPIQGLGVVREKIDVKGL